MRPWMDRNNFESVCHTPQRYTYHTNERFRLIRDVGEWHKGDEFTVSADCIRYVSAGNAKGDFTMFMKDDIEPLPYLDNNGKPITIDETKLPAITAPPPQQCRQPIQSGAYGRVCVGSVTHDGKRCVSIPAPGYGMTADELREAAHLFNQLAETLEPQQQLPKRPGAGNYVDPISAAKQAFIENLQDPACRVADKAVVSGINFDVLMPRVIDAYNAARSR